MESMGGGSVAFTPPGGLAGIVLSPGAPGVTGIAWEAGRHHSPPQAATSYRLLPVALCRSSAWPLLHQSTAPGLGWRVAGTRNPAHAAGSWMVCCHTANMPVQAWLGAQTRCTAHHPFWCWQPPRELHLAALLPRAPCL